MIDPTHWMAMVLIALKVCFRAVSGSLSLVTGGSLHVGVLIPRAASFFLQGDILMFGTN